MSGLDDKIVSSFERSKFRSFERSNVRMFEHFELSNVQTFERSNVRTLLVNHLTILSSGAEVNVATLFGIAELSHLKTTSRLAFEATNRRRFPILN